jgi:hypothetical protein
MKKTVSILLSVLLALLASTNSSSQAEARLTFHETSPAWTNLGIYGRVIRTMMIDPGSPDHMASSKVTIAQIGAL